MRDIRVQATPRFSLNLGSGPIPPADDPLLVGAENLRVLVAADDDVGKTCGSVALTDLNKYWAPLGKPRFHRRLVKCCGVNPLIENLRQWWVQATRYVVQDQ